MVFAGKDESSGLKSLEETKMKYLAGDQAFSQVIESLRLNLDYDQVFADNIKGRNVVLGCFFLRDDQFSVRGMLPEPSLVEGSFKGKI